MLVAKQLTCIRDDQELFSELSFALSPGQVMQVQGPNGAGKTTLLRMLCGLFPATEGEIHWQDETIQDCWSEYKSQLIYVGHKAAIKTGLTARENLCLTAATHSAKKDDLEEILAQVGMAGYEDVLCQQMSAGQQRRVALARLLMTKAQLWILDEPFTALDVHGVAWLEQLIAKHAARGGMAVLTSHQAINIDHLIQVTL